MAISTEDKIAGLYAAFFNRAADKSGFDSWVTKLKDGTNTLEDIAKGFASHDMFISTYGSLSNEEFVTEVYTNMTGQAGDTSGIAYYTEALNNNSFKSRSDMVSDFVQTVLTTNLSDSKYDSLTEDEKLSAQNRQDQLINKATVSQDFISKLGDITNPAKNADLNTDEAYLASIKILSQITHEDSTLKAAQDSLALLAKNKTKALDTLNSLDTINTSSVLKLVSPKISSIKIEDGNYTPDSIVDIIVTFDQDVVVSNLDSKISLNIGTYKKEALYSSKTSNSIIYKYTVEDGIADEERTISIPQDALSLNTTTIQNSDGYDLSLNNQTTENTDAIVLDNKAPSIVVNSANYTSNTDKLILNGSGFKSILEENEDTTIDLTDRFDFTKLVWDIDGVEQTPNTTVVTLSDAAIKLIKIESQTELSIVFNSDYTAIETAVNYGHNSGTQVDTLSINEGFTKDKLGNISTDPIVDNIILGIDNFFYGDATSNIITATSNADTIKGEAGDDKLYGLSGNDTIDGGAGDDTISGGTGVDTLTGGAGSDTFVFSTANSHSIIGFNTIEGIDKITDLVLNSSFEDKIKLDITVQNVNLSVAGKVDQGSFVEDINSLINIPTYGFDTDVSNDISATIVSVNDGDLNGKKYLLIDKNKSDTFTKDDFAIDITGVTITNFDTEVFV